MQFRVCVFFSSSPVRLFICRYLEYLESVFFAFGFVHLRMWRANSSNLFLDRSQQCAIDEVKHIVFEVMKKDCELSRHDMCVSEWLNSTKQANCRAVHKIKMQFRRNDMQMEVWKRRHMRNDFLLVQLPRSICEVRLIRDAAYVSRIFS